MGVLRFLRQYVLVAILAVVAAALGLFDMIGRIEQIWSWGVPGWAYEFAALIFLFAALGVLLFQLHSRMEAFEARSASVSSTPRDTGAVLTALAAKGNEPDYAMWDAHDRYRLGVAAYLWAERRPALTTDVPAYSREGEAYAMLRAAVLAGKLSAGDLNAHIVDLGPGDQREVIPAGVNPNRWVTRADLITFAKTTKQRPKFLFPDAR